MRWDRTDIAFVRVQLNIEYELICEADNIGLAKVNVLSHKNDLITKVVWSLYNNTEYVSFVFFTLLNFIVYILQYASYLLGSLH